MSLVKSPQFLVCITSLIVLAAGLSAPAQAQLPVSQVPLNISAGQSEPPLNMLVMGKDHKNYYEAYNDASDLNGDGIVDVGYKPDEIEYYGYFNSRVCYTWDSGNNRFNPAGAAGGVNGKQCSGRWSGDFLNYVTTGRLDALRKVLYGGWRRVDAIGETVLQGAYFPQDGHSWGKEYQSIARDGYNIADYTPLALPALGKYHLFAVTTTTTALDADNQASAPRLRVLRNSSFRVWNWLSIEGPVAGLSCFNASNSRVNCIGTSNTWGLVPSVMFSGLTESFWRRSSGGGSPGDTAAMNALFADHAIPGNLCGSRSATQISKGNNNPFNGVNGCTNDNFLSLVSGTLVIPTTGNYTFGIDGDDAIDLWIDGSLVVGWYGGHGASNNPADHSAQVFLTAGNYSIVFRHQEASGNDSYGLYWEDVNGATGRDDYYVRVLTCPANVALREDNCKVYGNGTSVKPTGLLHTFGEVASGETSPRMYFGLLTGSQFNNLRGGVLRRNLSNFSDEIDPLTGQFMTGVNGIARTLDRFRMIGGGYGNSVTDNSNGDNNWAWNNGTGGCPSVGNRAINNGECRMWGNPVGEMMLEALSYFAGGNATAVYTGSGSTRGVTEETTLGLTTETWKDPYKRVADGGSGFLACAQPVMTVISDINPSYDSDVPGNPWSTTDLPTLPATLAGFSLATEGQRIWNSEFGAGSRNIIIGELGAGYTDGAPTVKTASSFGTIRGLSPEEPTKAGSYSSSAVASFGWRVPNGINPLSEEKVRTYAVALASPLPTIEFPTAGGVITFVPFAKTAGGTFGGGPRHPTNTIVDFYVQKLVNLPGQEEDASVNDGRGYAAFRINYEDVEQGNDHDMDAIVLYEFTENADGTVDVKLTSEYAAGGAIQHMGYIASGTTADGVYLTVRDYDTTVGNSPAYRFNVPDTQSVGYCDVATMPVDCAGLPLVSTRTFTPSGGAGGSTTLRDPLWYAAKYGGFDKSLGDLPAMAAQWDEDNDGNPDNYFLVTNALSLKEALEKAFSKIISDTQNSGGVAASGARANAGFMAYVPEFTPSDWTGDLRAHKINPATGALLPALWSAKAKLAALTNTQVANQTSRKVYYIDPTAIAGSREKEFTVAGLGGAAAAAALLDIDVATAYPGRTIDELVNYLRGDHANEQTTGNPAGSFRERSGRIGDILSQPAVLDKAAYGYLNLPVAEGGGFGTGGYAQFVASKENRTPVAFVAANDGFIHAFDASETGGNELYAIAPFNVLDKLHLLASPSYVHRYFVNGSPTQGDAYIGGSWKTVLVGSTGAGGRSVYALDVTNPVTQGAKVLWEFTDPDLGLTIGTPKIALLPSGQWAAIFGNGYNSDNNQAFLYIVNLATGSLIQKIATNTEGTPGKPNGMATPAIIDLQGDGRTDIVYAGDYYGNLWKFSLSASGTTLQPTTALRLFTATDGSGTPQRQPITGGVTASVHPVNGQLVFFGTGSYFLTGDNAAPQAGDQVQTLYAIWDQGGAVVRNQLVQQTFAASGSGRTTSQNVVDWATNKGWYIDLQVGTAVSGERFVGQPTVELGRVFFTTYISEGDECEPGGVNWVNAFWTTSGTGGFAGGSSSFAMTDVSGPMTEKLTIVTSRTGGDEGDDDCDPATDPNCTRPNPDGTDADGDGNPDDLGIATPRGCVLSIDLMTAAGMNPLLRLGCGRQSWRQIQ